MSGPSAEARGYFQGSNRSRKTRVGTTGVFVSTNASRVAPPERRCVPSMHTSASSAGRARRSARAANRERTFLLPEINIGTTQLNDFAAVSPSPTAGAERRALPSCLEKISADF